MSFNSDPSAQSGLWSSEDEVGKEWFDPGPLWLMSLSAPEQAAKSQEALVWFINMLVWFWNSQSGYWLRFSILQVIETTVNASFQGSWISVVFWKMDGSQSGAEEIICHI